MSENEIPQSGTEGHQGSDNTDALLIWHLTSAARRNYMLSIVLTLLAWLSLIVMFDADGLTLGTTFGIAGFIFFSMAANKEDKLKKLGEKAKYETRPLARVSNISGACIVLGIITGTVGWLALDEESEQFSWGGFADSTWSVLSSSVVTILGIVGIGVIIFAGFLLWDKIKSIFSHK